MNSIAVLMISFAIYCGGYLLRFESGTPYEAINWFGPFGTTFFEYMIGVVCCKERFFEKLERAATKVKPIWRCVISAAVFVAMLLGHTLVIRSLVIAPLTGFLIICIFKFCPRLRLVDKVFGFFGTHSTNIWFTHMFLLFGAVSKACIQSGIPYPDIFIYACNMRRGVVCNKSYLLSHK